MIKSFADKETEKVWNNTYSRKLPSTIQSTALRKLRLIHDMISLYELRIPPSNHLEALIGNRKGQHSIRINRQWRICFRWNNGNAYNVEICDYH